MRNILTTSILALTLSAAAPALAKSNQKFESSLSAPASSAVQLEVVIGEDLAYLADNMPKKSSRSYSPRRLNAAFAANGYYGERDLNRLADRMERRLEKQLSKKGVAVDGNASTILRVVITDAIPNRPTFRQLSKDTNLSFQSYGNGGAAIKGELIAAGGENLGNVSYAWYANDIEWASSATTWSDANRVIDRFASKTAKTIGN